MSVVTFDKLDEKITEILENYVLSRNTFRSLEGGTTRWELSQRPLNKDGQCIWFVGKKKIIDNHMFDYADFKVILDKDCKIQLYYKPIQKEEFVNFLKEHHINLHTNPRKDVLAGPCHRLDINEVDDLSQFFVFTV